MVESRHVSGLPNITAATVSAEVSRATHTADRHRIGSDRDGGTSCKFN